MKRATFGMMASFASEESFLAALGNIREAGYRRIETYTPYGVERAESLMPHAKTPIPWIMLIGGFTGGCTAFLMQLNAVHDYVINVAGRPVNSWPSFIPITFELTVLSAALSGAGAFLWLAGFPRLDYPSFSDPRFRRASQDRFFICIRCDDPKYAAATAEGALLRAGPESVQEVFN